MLFTTNLIKQQIDEYAGYAYGFNAHTAGAHHALLTRFSKQMKIKTVGDISIDKVEYFLGDQVAASNSIFALKAIRSFLRFCKKAGYECLGYNELRTDSYFTLAGKPRLIINDMPYSKIQAAINRGIYKGVQRA